MKSRKVLITIATIVLLSFAWYKSSLRPVDSGDKANVSVQIPTGASVSAIASLLEGKDLIRSSSAFKLYARLHGKQSSLKAGSFILQRSESVPDIIATLTRGFSEETALTIPEGYTVKDIDALLADKGFTKPGAILACAKVCDFSAYAFLPKVAKPADRAGKVEGYLFPDTYFVVKDTLTPESFLKRLLDTFQKRVVVGLAADLKQSGRSLSDIMTMASLIEEETRTDEERPTVAGILWKRYDAKIGLGVDASVRYVLNKPTAAITKSDLDIDSPYNLRKYRGLPPTPIANPGIESIKAALHPVASDYLFYLHGTDGKIHYAKTNDEHNENRAKYLR